MIIICKQLSSNNNSSSSHTASMGFPLSIRVYYPSLLAHLPDYIFCLHRAVVCKFLLVSQHNILLQGSIGECYL